MNRHQSNPFLAGWDLPEDDALESQSSHTHNMDPKNESETNHRSHHVGSQNDIADNPFKSQQSNDRRLYHRNMSSFDAASQQLEQQHSRKNGSTDQDQIDQIAKLTAEFQSAIETKDKEFSSVGGEIPSNQNIFDPFETINDEDVSLTSPVLSTKNQTHEFTNASRPDELPSSKDQQFKSTHDSIDDDDAELVSTPVRNIKSSPFKNNAYENDAILSRDMIEKGANIELDFVDARIKPQDPNNNTDSMEKATLFASLLASAESDGQQNIPEDNINGDSDKIDGCSELSNMEQATRIIKGSHSSRDGNVERPISFFDPFETVIDKDSLTSLMNDVNQKQGKAIENGQIELDNSILIKDGRDGNAKSSLDLEDKSNMACEYSSVGKMIEKAVNPSDKIDLKSDAGVERKKELDDSSNQEATENKMTSSGSLPKSRMNEQKKISRNKKKSGFSDDSSDSSDDDRIQIVIKQKMNPQADSNAQPILVPLLPPPPSKNSMKLARERGQVEDIPSPIMSYKSNIERRNSSDTIGESNEHSATAAKSHPGESNAQTKDEEKDYDEQDEHSDHGDQFVIPMTLSDEESEFNKPEAPLYDEDTSYVLEEFPKKYNGPGWDMMLRYPPKKKLTSNRFWKKIFVKIAQVPVIPDKTKQQNQVSEEPQTCIVLQVYDKPDDKKPMQEIPIQATYTVSDISSQQFDQFGKIFTIKLQYIFYKERVGVRQGQLARFIHSGHIGSSTTSGGHGVDPISIGAIKRAGAPIEHSPQISQIIKLGCIDYEDIRQFKNCLEDYLFMMPIHRERTVTPYKTEEVQMAVRDETYIELNQVGTITKQLARVRLFFLSFLNGTPRVEVGINAMERQGREVVGRMDILPVVTEEWIRVESWELHTTVQKEEFENPESRIIALVPPDATFFELMRFRVRPPRNSELPLQISANMTVTRTKVSINCEVMIPGCVSRRHGQIPCENIAIRINIPECWIYFFREEKHFRMGSKKAVNRRPGKVKGIERFLGGGGLQDLNDETSLIEVTSGQAKYEHHHHAIVWRAARWPKESQSAYVQNTMKIRLPLTPFDKMPESFYEYVHVEYTMPATTVSHTTLRSISVNPYDDEPPEKYVKYSAKYEYKVKMRQSINLGSKTHDPQPEASPIIIMKQPDLQGDLQRELDSDDESDNEADGSDQADR